jgi:hypothetical protein
MIRFLCLACGKLLSAPDSQAGTQTRCPSCGDPVSVPRPGVLVKPRVDPPPRPVPPAAVNPPARRGGSLFSLVVAGVLLAALLAATYYWELLPGLCGTPSGNVGPRTGMQKAAAPAAAPTDFDPNSAEQTLRWLAGQARLIVLADVNAPGNALARNKAVNDLQMNLSRLGGRTVRWQLPVVSVEERGISLRGLVLSVEKLDEGPPRPVPPGMPSQYALDVRAKDGSEFFAVAAEDWVLRLKRGDLVSLHGTIERLHFDETQGHFSIRFEQHQLAPAGGAAAAPR